MRSTVNKNVVKAPKKKRRGQDIYKIDPNSLALPGPPLTPEQFREMILSRENGPTISLEELEAQWARRKKKLLKLVEQEREKRRTRK